MYDIKLRALGTGIMRAAKKGKSEIMWGAHLADLESKYLEYVRTIGLTGKIEEKTSGDDFKSRWLIITFPKV